MTPQPQQETVGTSKPRGWEAFVPRGKVLLAARLTAEGSMALEDIALEVGLTTQAFASWRRKPVFMEVVAAYRERINAEVMESARKLLAEAKRNKLWKRKRLNGRQA